MQFYFFIFIVIFFNFFQETVAENNSDIENYILQESHLLNIKLSKIFQREPKSYLEPMLMFKLGFEPIKRSSDKNKCIIVKHPDLKGFIFKFYKNEKGKVNKTELLIKRIKGMQKINEAISKNNFQDFFLVPKKWLWKPPQKIKKNRQPQYILIAEDMNILNREENMIKWKSNHHSHAFLFALYKIIKDLGLNDSIYIDNIPFTKSGMIAFVDTEHYDQWPIDFEKLTRIFSPAVKLKFQEIIQNHSSSS